MINTAIYFSSIIDSTATSNDTKFHLVFAN